MSGAVKIHGKRKGEYHCNGCKRPLAECRKSDCPQDGGIPYTISWWWDVVK